MTTFTRETAINSVMQAEGGAKYTNDPNDRGGPTRYGITEVLCGRYRSLWAAYSFNGDMSQLPAELAFNIYQKEFWDSLCMDTVLEYSSALAYLLFNIGVNSGPGAAATHLQRALNVYNQNATLYPDVGVDGSLGPASMSALQKCLTARGADGLQAIIMTVFSLQMILYINLAEKDHTQERFSLGWANRIITALKEFD